jgi:hypothetical protein
MLLESQVEDASRRREIERDATCYLAIFFQKLF